MYMFETTTGWMLAVANAVLAIGIYRFAMTRSGNAFLWWAIGANALRTLIFAIVVVAVALLGVGHMLSFLVTVLVGYACFLVLEVAYIARRI